MDLPGAPRHRGLAVEGLDAERGAEFERLWQQARWGRRARLSPPAPTPSRASRRVHRLGGAVGDCRRSFVLEPGDDRGTVRQSDWILHVADVAAQLKEDLARIPVTAPAEQTEPDIDPGHGRPATLRRQASRAERVNALRTADVRLQRADPKYASAPMPTWLISCSPAPTRISTSPTTGG